MCAREKNRFPSVSIACFLLFFAAIAVPAFAVVYQTDFSSDPNWTTNDPNNLYWDSVTQTYHALHANGSSKYAYVLVDYTPGQSFCLRFDQIIDQVPNGAGATVGVFNSSIDLLGTGVASHWVLVSGDYWSNLYAGNPVGTAASEVSDWEPNVWYTVQLEYDSSTNIAKMQGWEKETGVEVTALTLLVSEGLPLDLDRIGIPKISCESLNICEYRIDNLTFIPEPATLSLLVLGGAVVAARRRKG